jgi:RNA polymerase sigma factor (sigma-70 family)
MTSQTAHNLKLVGSEIGMAERDSLIDQVQIINEREGGLIEAYVPVDLVNQEEVAVDQAHVIELADSIKQQSKTHEITGQLSPVLLGQLTDQDKFVILDGFHRVPAVKLAGSEIVYATIKTNCTPEDVIDLRIVAANSHKKVKFARIVDWIDEAWQTTPWADRANVSQAFVMTFLNSAGTGKGKAGNGLTKEDVQEIRGWVRAKCEQWDVNPGSVDRYLRTARQADPELVKSARERNSGHKLEAVTPKHLDSIVRHLPNEYMFQEIVARAAVANNLTVPQTQSLALAVAKAKTYEEMDSAIDSKIWERMSSAAKSLAGKRYKEIDPTRPETYVATLVDKFFDDQIEIVEGLIENAILKGTYKPKIETAPKRINDLLLLSEVEVEEVVQELPADQAVKWSPDRLSDSADKVARMQPFLSKMIRRQFPFNEDDAEDIISVATMRFLDRVNDGRLPEQYSEEHSLRRLMANFVTYAAIDEVRRVRGRNGQKPHQVSIHKEDDEGRSLEDVLGTEDNFELSDEAKPQADNQEFIKNLLPFLGERQRRVLIMKAHFELTAAEIADILGTTEASVAQSFVTLKRKAIKLSEEAQTEVLHITD